MEFKTKFNVNDFVCVMFDNKIEKLKVSRIQVTNDVDDFDIKYIMKNNFNTFGLIYNEKFLFKTREELLKSL
jgi:hypothetical protein